MAPVESKVEVAPAEGLTGQALCGAVKMAAVAEAPENAPQKQKKFIEEGLVLGSGG